MTPPPNLQRRSQGRRNSDALIRRAAAMAHLGWWHLEIVDPSDLRQSKVIWSDEIYRIFGNDPQKYELAPSELVARILSEDRDMAIATARRAVAEGETFRIEFRVFHADGSVRTVEATGALETDETGRPVRMVGTILDLTDRRRVERALRGADAASRLMAQIVEHSHEAIISTTLDGVITTWNPAAERLFGWRADEIIGRAITTLIPEDYRSDTRAYDRLRRGEAIPPFQTVRRRRDESLVEVEITISPVFDEHGDPVGAAGIVRDMTERRRIAAQLQHAQRLESIGRLAGGVAHDFNNLLMAITGYAELVRMELPNDAPAQEDMRAILASAERGARLTRQLLAFGRRQVLHPVELDLNAVVRDMEGVLRPLAGSEVTLQLSLDSDVAGVRADRAQIEQVVVNLVANARDAMPHGGVLDVSTTRVTLDSASAAAYGTVPPGEYVRLGVRDTGIGMDADVQARLFEPFFTTKPRGSATGMGLATTYGIVKQSGGFITVDSRIGEGTTIHTFLPFVAGVVAAPHPAERPRLSGSMGAVPSVEMLAELSGGETILVVEDDPDVRTSASAVLERLGYAVLQAGTPSAALDIVRARGREIDLMLTDVLLPEMSGLELAEVVLAGHPHIAVVRMSGFAGDTGEFPIAAPFLQKPFSAETLARAVRGALSPR